MPVSRFRAAVSSVAALALVGAQGGALAAAPPMTRADYEACQARDEPGFKAAIEAITLKALTNGVGQVDFKGVVAEQWRRGGLDDLIDQRVDIAIAEIKDETSWAGLLQSLASGEKAQELATAVADRVYRSAALKTAIETLAVGVGREVGRTIELATVDAGEPALQCIEAFLGPRYGMTVARVVTRDAGREFSADPAKGGAQVSAGAVLLEGREGLAGAVVLLVRRQLSNMASRVGQRLVGSVLGRLVSVVAGGVGLVLIAKDIWDFRHGVLPIIAAEMKSKSIKDKVQDELARAVAEQITENLREIAAKTAERVVEIWHDFRRAHAKVLDLAERNDGFKRFLNSARPEELPRLDEVVGLLVAEEGERGVLKRLDDGSLHHAVNTLPPAGMEIARETRSIGAALAWSTLAGSALPKVLENEVHRRAKPDSFTKASLARVLGLQDRLAITRLAGVDRAARDILFELDDGDLKSLARGLAESELETLSRYLTGLERQAGQRVLRAVAQAPAKMQALAAPRVRDAVLASRDQMAAVAMMLRADVGLDLTAAAEHARLVYDGRVSSILLWEKHAGVLSLLGLAALLLVLMLRRLVFGRRPVVVANGARRRG